MWETEITLSDKIKLDEECWSCTDRDDKPPISTLEDGITCAECNGSGWRLTNAGQSIIDLVKRHIK